jgi:UDP-N-acetylglucosamine/UDP-N-acetylgalactosamine diphosphorylase
MNEGYRASDMVAALMKKGVTIPNPCGVEIDDTVKPERISEKEVILHSGTKLYGAKTLICEGAELGFEGPVTAVDCQIGRRVKLNGGFFKGSAFLDGVEVSCGAHVREGCILEEEARAAHTVGLKQTILFPFVTLGSLINFCDCLMSGGTDSKNHSEVGSSYIHFNYTPNQDKATASLIGDVPTGVMLDQPPIFLGGQGGLVGPARIGHGTVIAAGTVYRKDSPEGGKLLKGNLLTPGAGDFHRGLYCAVSRKVRNNICYIAHLLALKEWYLHVRRPLFQEAALGAELWVGALEKLDMAITERVKRLKAFAGNMTESARIGRSLSAAGQPATDYMVEEEISLNWPLLEECFTRGLEASAALDERNRFLSGFHTERPAGAGYVESIRALNGETKKLGTEWLQGIVDRITGEAFAVVPLCQ